MAFKVLTPSNYFGAHSAHWLAVAHNSGGLTFASNASDVTALALIRVEMAQATIAFAFRISQGFANNESLQMAMSYTSLVGTTVVTGSITLDDANTPAGGGEFAILQRGVVIPPGSIVALVRTYTAGGQANNPIVAVGAQFY